MVASRIRLFDVPALLVLLRPMRCDFCQARQYQDRVPAVGRLFRLSLLLTVGVLVGAMVYAEVTDRSWMPMDMFKIDAMHDSKPSEATNAE